MSNPLIGEAMLYAMAETEAAMMPWTLVSEAQEQVGKRQTSAGRPFFVVKRIPKKINVRGLSFEVDMKANPEARDGPQKIRVQEPGAAEQYLASRRAAEFLRRKLQEHSESSTKDPYICCMESVSCGFKDEMNGCLGYAGEAMPPTHSETPPITCPLGIADTDRGWFCSIVDRITDIVTWPLRMPWHRSM